MHEWNREHKHYAITPARKQGRLDGEESAEEDDSGLAKDGDDFLQQMSRMRGQMMPEWVWPHQLRRFAKEWMEYKQANGLLDFTDLIETCYRDVAVAPKQPSVIFADEAQDLNKLQLSLVRKWGERAEYFIVAGDDDQTIFSFTGATPEAMLHPEIPDAQKIILKQSYRVPRAVHALAEKTIRQVSVRQEKEYLPRPADGLVVRLATGDLNSTEYGMLTSAEKHLAEGKTLMFLASCSYMLKPLVQVLRKHGLPFHNPYRTTNSFWNPIRMGKRGATSNRIVALLAGHPSWRDHRTWTQGDVALWAEWLKSKGVLRHGAKKLLQQAIVDQEAGVEYLDTIFEPAALDSLMTAWEGDHRALLSWWRKRLTVDVSKRSEFPATIAERLGIDGLLDVPRIVVGTIHSVKGGQADVVYLFPDLSSAGDAQYIRTGPSRDSVVRLFYVGMTRARETLYICQPASHRAFRV